MCQYCRRSGYHAMGCPNAPDEPTFGECYSCGELFHTGDKQYRLGDKIYCDTCVENSCEIAGDDW